MNDGPRLAGRTALVTGGGQGIGRGIALALAAEGAHVVVTGRTGATLDAVVTEIEERGGRGHAVTGDVGVRADVDGWVEQAVATFGRLDVLVNNAQSLVQRPLAETSLEDVELAYRSGPLGAFHTMQAALAPLRERGGSIVNLASSAALVGQEGFASYAMAKEAIRGLTRVASREWGRYGIRVNAICPVALSPGAAAYFEAHPEAHDKVVSEIPLGRLGDPVDDIGRAVVALASDDMRYLTGATLMLEGGRTLLG
ncbi:SDR family NAD(P)-dependent oxidoreductase [Kitasatospora sp. NPDC101235]|uniref:SDR family NAD(P)-dependent oxidoreductase n=1 Tax=Kitasatospora sp. NPDC101235 TaxID=3364101 RepID=UPI0037F572AD